MEKKGYFKLFFGYTELHRVYTQSNTKFFSVITSEVLCVEKE